MGIGPLYVLAHIEEQEERRRDASRQLRLYKQCLRDISNPFLLEEEYFRKHYRLTPCLAMRLINMLERYIEPERISKIPSYLQVLAVLQLLGQGSFQRANYHDFLHPMSQASMSRCIDRIINAILMFSNEFIKFPTTPQERQQVSMNFLRNNRIQSILGVIDCFKVAFKRPAENEEAFFNYNAGTSMNVQVVADSNYVILNIRVCPGSNTDQFIWQHSDLNMHMMSLRSNEDIVRNEGYYYLLGDNGYSPSPVLLTPIIGARDGSPEYAYTTDHVSTRCKIEQCFGILTNVWFAINRARKLYYEPEKVGRIILACAVLHNFRKLNGMIDEIPPVLPEDLDHPQLERNFDYFAGVAERARLINLHYN